MDSLIRRRASIKGQLTAFANFIESITNNELMQVELIELQRRFEHAQSFLEKFNELQIEIEILVDDETGIADQACQRDQFETSYYRTVAKAEQIIAANSKCGVSPASSRGSHTSSVKTGSSNHLNSPNTNNDNIVHSVKLPAIPIPHFDGRKESWLEFRDLFVSLIHNNEGITDINKFFYLRGALRGKAVDAISSINFCSQNYNAAWEALCSRYNSKRVLIHNHIKSLFEIKPIFKESSEKLRSINDLVSLHVQAITSLTPGENLWDQLVVYLITSKLDPVTSREWEENKERNELSTLADISTFLKKRADLLENLESRQSYIDIKNAKKSEYVPKVSRSLIANSKPINCPICNLAHYASDCTEFTKLDVSQRMGKVKELKLCLNCFRKGHFVSECRSSFCRICKRKHHTLLHPVSSTSDADTALQTNIEERAGEQTTTVAAFSAQFSNVLLATISVTISDANGTAHNIRGILDAGSQSSFISKRTCDLLQLATQKADVLVNGIGQHSSQTLEKCLVKISSRHTSFKIHASCLVIDNITGNLPNFVVDTSLIKLPKHVKLSDSSYHMPGKIDLLIGSDWFWKVISKEQINLGPKLPILQNTRFGWVVTGPMTPSHRQTVHCNFSSVELELNEQLSKFWELENGPTEKPLTVEERYCESHFVETHKRDSNGRFTVTIPLKDTTSKLGETYEIAKRRLFNLEKRFQSDQNLSISYSNFINEYLSLGHMSESQPKAKQPSYYMPHFGILKEESLSTKLRVVFDASTESTSGYSFNSLQMVGPTIQQELFFILLRFRKYTYAFSADVQMMYRQILVEPSQRSCQKILWRSSPDEVIKEYELNTVTYGTAAAPFLAIRSLYQLGKECADTHPRISKIIQKDFYVDDVLSGEDTLVEAQNSCSELSSVLRSGAFKLRKWLSNDPNVLSKVEHADVHPQVHDFAQGQAKTLGLVWSFNNDTLTYRISKFDSRSITKRKILSEVSQIFDPLGLLSPCIVPAKFLLQRLWEEKLSWDDALPHSLATQWLELRDDLYTLNDLKIDRKVICKRPHRLELHGFSDASTHGYGACIYLRSTDENNTHHVSLLCSRNRVAPLKPVTIPRLELCGAVILAKLVSQARKALDVTFHETHLWTDSTIVLGWLRTPINLLKPFVSHRTAEIIDLVPTATWSHVPTDSNPADILSRGIAPSKLRKSSLWWHGPPWLSKGSDSWPRLNCKSEQELPELKNEKYALTTSKISKFAFENYSSLSRLQRIIAYVLRFKSNTQNSVEQRVCGPLSLSELQDSLHKLVKMVQAESFDSDLQLLKEGKPLHKTSKILNLNPFLDDKGLLRVGGRLQNSDLAYGAKHPILLPHKHTFTTLLFEREHANLFHVGPQMLLSSIRQRFWPISGRSIARQVVRNCVRCFKASPKTINPFMGNLPTPRVSQALPFERVGVDYAGPIALKTARGRGCKTYKSYICLFVCLTTKALHLELVGDLTAQSFILCLRRLASRRGKPSEILSDNGRNFVGAHSELKQLAQFLIHNECEISERAANEGVSWKFIPPYSPNFGGLWEAGVKSCKLLLKKITNNSLLTYEEFNTLLVQVEGILNSRPLTPLSSNPNDLQPLCPAHFLIGKPITAIPDPDVSHIPENRLSKYQRIQQLQQQFWRRWTKEYLFELQKRSKWNTLTANVQIGDMVLIRDENLPPLKWKMGRIELVHPGEDGIVRVITLRTTEGLIKRATNRVCPLPSS